MIRYNIIHLQEVASTNTYLKELIKKEHAEEGTVILADRQTAGRGRGNNSWFAEGGMSIAMSIFTRPSLKTVNHFMLNEMFSLTLVDVLAAYNMYAKVKWPNDIYIAERKIAGLLIENVLMGDTITESVLGVGINVNQHRFPANLPNPVSMAQVLERSIELKAVTEKLLDCFGNRYEALKAGNYSNMHAEYSSYLHKRGEMIRFTCDGQPMEGILFNVFQTGELCVRLNNGMLRNFLFDEIQGMN